MKCETKEKPMEANDMKAMREALTNLTRYEESDIRQLEQLAKRAIDNEIYGGGILQSMCEAIREGKEALSAPPRNCDRFATWQEAKAAFWQEVGDPADWQRLLEWLYAHSHVEYK